MNTLRTGNVEVTSGKDQGTTGVASGQIETDLRQHWAASAAGNQDVEHEIYHEQAICDYPQSGERIHGKRNLQSLRSHHPGKPTGFKIGRLLGSGKLWITEYMITYQGRSFFTISIMEFEGEKVIHETQYFAEPFNPPEWRAQWVERLRAP